MEFGSKSLGVLVIAVAGVVVGAYNLGQKQAEKTPSSPHSGAAQVAQGAGTQQLPANHPPATQAAGQPADQSAEQLPAQDGKLDVDHSAKFVHFRVGNSNVKRMYSDGKILWVGTSKGVIRYDTSTDQYRLFDNRSGLLDNNVYALAVAPNGDIWAGTKRGVARVGQSKSGSL